MNWNNGVSVSTSHPSSCQVQCRHLGVMKLSGEKSRSWGKWSKDSWLVGWIERLTRATLIACLFFLFYKSLMFSLSTTLMWWRNIHNMQKIYSPKSFVEPWQHAVYWFSIMFQHRPLEICLQSTSYWIVSFNGRSKKPFFLPKECSLLLIIFRHYSQKGGIHSTQMGSLLPQNSFSEDGESVTLGFFFQIEESRTL